MSAPSFELNELAIIRDAVDALKYDVDEDPESFEPDATDLLWEILEKVKQCVSPETKSVGVYTRG